MRVGSKHNLARLQNREKQINRAWVFDNYIVAKCGNVIVYKDLSVGEYKYFWDIGLEKMDLALDDTAWVEDVLATGI